MKECNLPTIVYNIIMWYVKTNNANKKCNYVI